MSSQRVIAFLALQHQPVRRLYVAGTLWLDSSEQRSLANLRSALWRLGDPGARIVEIVGQYLQLAAGVEVDLDRNSSLARRLVSELDQPVSDSELRQCTFTEDLLPGWYEDWVMMERARFHQLRMHALEAIALRLTRQARYAEAVEIALAAVAADPLRESAQRVLIGVHVSEGNQGEAMRQYRTFRDLLRVELGVEPSLVLQQLVGAASSP
jgi:DNA-binding SARP family transcriptional activator